MSAFCENKSCMKKASVVCSRCSSEYYCGKECQLAAFKCHRINCFELPPLLKIVKNEDISAMIDEKDPLVEEAKMQDQELVEQVDLISDLERMTVVPQVSSEKKIQEKPKGQIKVPFAAGARSVPPRSYEIPLKTVPTPVSQFVADEPMDEKKQLRSSSLSLISNNRQMLPKKFSLVKKNETPRILYKDLPKRALPADRFKASIVCGDIETKVFHICEYLEEIGEYLEMIGSAIQNHVAKTVVIGYKPEKNEIVLAKYEEVHYRAHCIGKRGEDFKVHFIDYGNIEFVNEKDLLPISESLKFDIFVHMCRLENVPDKDHLSDETSIFLNQDFIEVENAEKISGENIYVGRVVGI